MYSNRFIFIAFIFFIVIPVNSYGMHIAEGFLSPAWSLTWWLISLPFLILGFYAIKRSVVKDSRAKLYMGIAGGFVFVLSALKLPSVTGSCSHLTGAALGTLLLGPWVMVVICCIVLLFQALLLAHGGITTLGANVFSMAIVGALVAYFVRNLGNRLINNKFIVVFLAAMLANFFTYITTAIQLALAYPDGLQGVTGAFIKFASLFAFTQLPLAIVEGIITVYAYKLILKLDNSLISS